jgi:hypothetical protein
LVYLIVWWFSCKIDSHNKYAAANGNKLINWMDPALTTSVAKFQFMSPNFFHQLLTSDKLAKFILTFITRELDILCILNDSFKLAFYLMTISFKKVSQYVPLIFWKSNQINVFLIKCNLKYLQKVRIVYNHTFTYNLIADYIHSRTYASPNIA